MEWESGSSCHSYMLPRQGHRCPRRCSDWELELRDCSTIPGRGLLLTTERWTEGMWGRRLWWEIPVEESWAAMETRQYCWRTLRGWSHQHILSLPRRQHLPLTVKRLDQKVTDTPNFKVGPHPGCPLSAWCTNVQSRTSARAPLHVPDAPTTEKDPRHGSPLSA